MLTFASLCSGGGLADLGAIAAGLEPIFAVEADNDIADVFEMNHKTRLVRARLEETDPRRMQPPDILWVSPSCTRYSVANSGGEESPIDLACAEGVCEYIYVMRPRAFLLENVTQYRQGEAFKMIIRCLAEQGYFYATDNVVSADYGDPQTRRRLIVRALRDGMLPPLPSPKPWRGWYDAIEDLIPTLPESKFAPWQLARLPPELQTVLIDGRNTRTTNDEPATVCPADKPAFTVTISDGAARHRAFLADKLPSQLSFLVERQGARNGPLVIRNAKEPAWTVRAVNRNVEFANALLVDGQNGRSDSEPHLSIREQAPPALTVTNAGKGVPRAYLEQGRVVSMTSRALARFQSVPDTYILPMKPALACKVIGNGVPVKMATALLRGLAECL